MTDTLTRLSAALSDRYTIERELGEGGMATVYLAEDIKHHRKVAIKLLKPELAAVLGAERFVQEITTTAALQHPHILPLFDSGEADGFLYYVMPFIDGETLRDKLSRETQFGIDEAVKITTEIADALHYAHSQGVVHRDIKPENILLANGRPMVADFGIALAVSAAAGGRMTETGLSLGTPHYMSPEQATAEKEITARSDVYSLGSMLYEMLAGEPPHLGGSAQQIIMKIIAEDPQPLTVLRKSVPQNVAAAVAKSLEKLPADRFQSAEEFGKALVDLGFTTAMMGAAHGSSPAANTRVLYGMGAALLVMTGIAGWALMQSPVSAGGPTVFDAVLPDSALVSFAASAGGDVYGGAPRNISISEDGAFAVYTAQEKDSTSLWYRSLVDDDVHPIPGTVGGKAPRISPDGSQVGFLLDERMMLVPIGGGEARQLHVSPASGLQEWISPNELLVVDADGNRVNWIDPGGDGVRSKAILSRCAFGSWIPEVQKLACSFNRMGTVIDPETDESEPIRSTTPDGRPGGKLAGTDFRVVDQRYLVYIANDGSLRAASYDPTTALVGRSVSMVTGIRREAVGEGQFDIAATGTLVYAPGVDATIGRMVRLRPGGVPEPLPLESNDFHRYDLSRDGRWLAAAVQGAELNELRVYDLRDGQQFTWLRGEMVRHVLWDSGADTLLFAVNDSSSWTVLRGAPSSGVAADTLATFAADPSNPDPLDIPSDRVAVAQDWGGSVVLRFDPTVVPSKFDTVLTEARFPSVSPGGNLVVYQTLEGSRIVVTGFPTPGRRWQIASQGVEPLWLSASEVIFRLGVSWYVSRVNPETGEPLGAPVFWGRDPRFSDTSGWSNRLSHDGGIIYLQGSEQISATYLRVIPNWVAQMKAAVDEANR